MMKKDNLAALNSSPEEISKEGLLPSNDSVKRRKALLQIGKYSSYIAPILIASMSGKAQAGS